METEEIAPSECASSGVRKSELRLIVVLYIAAALLFAGAWFIHGSWATVALQSSARVLFLAALFRRTTWIGYFTTAILIVDVLNSAMLASMDHAWFAPIVGLLPAGSETWSVVYFVAQWPLTLLLILCTLAYVAFTRTSQSRQHLTSVST